MIEVTFKSDFMSWREKARQLFLADYPPDRVVWIEADDEQNSFAFASDSVPSLADLSSGRVQPRVPKEFLETAKLVAVHRDGRRWNLLYRMLWRLNHGEPHLLEVETDDDTLLLQRMVKSVGRDIHKMHAFVRFRKVEEEGTNDPLYLAWHCPDHAIFKLAAPFFARRFKTMRWSILTPDGSAYWDGKRLDFGPGVSATMAPKAHDDLETLWRSYYGAIFNPARVKTTAMKREMPVRHWRTLPETTMIPELLADSAQRVATMLAQQPSSAAPYVPTQPASYESLEQAAQGCAGCDLGKSGCKVNFGHGSPQARIVVVADQAGDRLDSPALHPLALALLFDELAELGISAQHILVTYAVKHTKFKHHDPKQPIQRIQARDVAACRPWLGAEFAYLKPDVIVCLGSAAALAVLGRVSRLQEDRGRWLSSGWNARILVTDHPASILAITDSEEQAAACASFRTDLKQLGDVIQVV